MELIQAGTTATSATVTDSRTTSWKVMAKTAVEVTVHFFGDVNGTGPGVTITIPVTNTAFVDVPGDFQKITVTGGTVCYLIFA